MPQTARKLTPENLQFTYEDYLLLPDDGKRYEIIEGELFMTPAPIIKHQNVLRELGKHIDNFVVTHNLGIVFLAPCDVILSKTNIVQPDIIFISKENRVMIKEKNIQGAPDLLIEITSPNTKERDLVLKKKLYAKFGVKEYWIVFMQEEMVKIWKLEDDAIILDGVFEKQDILKSSLVKGLEIKLSEVFREMEDYFS
ncbi:MAG: Uma2 family endonuclease [bacterium]